MTHPTDRLVEQIAMGVAARGYDGHIAIIFTRSALRSRRIVAGMSLPEAVDVVAGHLTPVGVFGLCDVAPCYAPPGRHTLGAYSNHPNPLIA